MSIILFDSLLKLSALRLGEWDGRAISRNAIPNFLDQGQPFLRRETVNTQRFDRSVYTVTSSIMQGQFGIGLWVKIWETLLSILHPMIVEKRLIHERKSS